MADYTKQGLFVEDGPPPLGPAQLNAFDDGIADAATHHRYGTFAARPAASALNKNHIYWAYDTGQQFRSNGATWDELAVGNGGIQDGAVSLTKLGAGVTALLPSSSEKSALLTRFSGPSWAFPGVGYNAPPGNLNRYLSEADRAIKFFDIPAAGGGTVDFWPGDGYWMVKAVYGFHYDANVCATALIACGRSTFDGATRQLSIRDQWTPASNVSTTFAIINQSTVNGVIRATTNFGNTRIFLFDYRGIPPT